ncbi:DUF6415 family natural product biosynthesis protein [Streptomyces adustus]|uniref:DUF6415 family natural product biosynthesis protein n=1 Tax=Streptomyces adustus TaxID=1609272 RepID=UPI00371A0587
MTTVASFRARQIPPWTPPLDTDGLKTVLTKSHGWQPFEHGSVLNDVAIVPDHFAPNREQTDELAPRMRNHLGRLADIAAATDIAQPDKSTNRHNALTHLVCSATAPDACWPAVGHLRQTAWTVNELLERPTELHSPREAT